ncbi:hypothetical protein F511_00986 [Dorcoceras hygrometricum]|uniref:TFIIS N-terminal domain-containing protein n=1 Tax=Dorcoceras hygrometricum TaxID=472368 RepID=A0A2Z7ALQ8_9LAMI|nr:hypothetical protein F511_00986 [Dorcoceras hygrometricum]
MMLDDCFTLTEMNHGLTSLSQVMELVEVMQKGRNGSVNATDTIRQWLAVASVIAATENKDCLNLFIQSDGVQLIDKWLKDVQKCINDSDKSLQEETVIHLLHALETLHMRYEKLISSEIWITVEDLLVHGNSKVQGKARVLFESWKLKRESVDSVSLEKVGALANDEMDESEHVQSGSGCSKSPRRYSSPSSDFSGLEKGQESATNELVPSTASEALHPSPVGGACNANKILDSPLGDDSASKVVPPLSKTADGFPMGQSMGTTLVKSSMTAVPMQDMNDGLAEFLQSESTGDLVHAPKFECSPEKFFSLEESKRSENKVISSSSDVANVNDSGTEHGNKISCKEGPPVIDSENFNSCGKDVMDDASYGDKCRSSPPDLSCQAATGVERAAVDSKEQNCSSEKPSEGTVRQPCNLDPVSENQFHDNEGSHNKVMNISELSAEASQMQEFATCIGNPGLAKTNSALDMETSQVTEFAHEEATAEKGQCEFDLNQEVCSEDTDGPVSQNGPSIVSASMCAPGLPVSPMQFEGSHDWRGSANKSDSLPASPGQGPKMPLGFYSIDLNATEIGDGNTRDLLFYKRVPIYSDLHSGESSVDTDSRKSEHHDLNLNVTSEDDGVPSDWRIWHHLPEANDHQHRSHSSPVSSKQPLSIIDLNDQPMFLNDSCDISCLSKVNVSRGIKTDESIISIMGARVKVNSKDLVPQAILFPNDRTPGLTFDVKVGRTESCFAIGSVLPYTHSPVYGYNNLAPFPEVDMLPSSSLYGSGGRIPYMVDSRGPSVIPQTADAGFSESPFVSNMMSSDEAGPSGSGYDLNSVAMVKDGGGDSLVLRDFLNIGPVRSIDDDLRNNTLLTIGSVVSRKRKEPDNVLEHYPFRNYTPPWN